jgi:asparagine synthase (glutamine-hydrolysing)
MNSATQASLFQGTKESPVRPCCLDPEFGQLAEPFFQQAPFNDRLRNLQYRDACQTKIPRALRFNDRISMRSSTELREPFLDHRLVELAFSQPTERKILNGVRKRILRNLTADLLPSTVSEAPKRPLQTPQREWLRGPLRDWAAAQINAALEGCGQGWLSKNKVDREWATYCSGVSDNSFYIWQWINLGLLQIAAS